MFYSKSTGGFYDDSIHGARRLLIDDPAWVRPVIGGEPDMDAVPATIEVDNPDCRIPADAVEITAEAYAALLAGQSEGKRIVADAGGRPVLADPPPLTAEQVLENIKTKRDVVKAGGVLISGKWFHTDDASRIQYLGLDKMAEKSIAAGGTDDTPLQYGGTTIQWKTMGGSFVPMTVGLAQAVIAAVSGLDFVAFAVAEQHRAAMTASANAAGYDYSAGWPASFEPGTSQQ